MKELAIMAMLLAALGAGAAAQTQAPAPPPAAAPAPPPQTPEAPAASASLEGAWSGAGEGIRPDGSMESLALTMTVVKQVGQLFAGTLVVARLDPEGNVMEQESLLFTGHLSADNRLSLTLIPQPGAEEPPQAPAAAVMNGTLAGQTLTGTWENLTFGNTGWAALKKQVP